MFKRILKIALIVVLCLVLVVGSYAAYVFLSYSRLDDNMTLDVNAGAQISNVPVGQDLKILSYNIGFGAYNDDFTFFMDGGSESRSRSEQICIDNVKGSLSVATKQNADIILFQEVDVDGTRSHGVNQFEILKGGLEGYSSTFAQNYDSPYLFWPLTEPHGANRSGIAAFSRFNINSALRRSLPIEEGVMKILDLDRCYSVNRLTTENGKELVLYNVHLSAYTSDGTIATEQLEMLLNDMQEEYKKGNYCLAGGDFNKDLPGDAGNTEHPWAQPIPENLIPSDFTLVAPKANPTKSCRDTGVVYDQDTTFTITLDGFIVSNNITAVKDEVIDAEFLYSDHNPVYMNFVLLP